MIMDSCFFLGLVLGAVEGLTEFLPVSSTGHLIIAGDLLDFSGPKASAFQVTIQLGAVLAVVILYWRRFMGLIVPGAVGGFAGMRGLALLALTTLPPCVAGLLLHSRIKELFTPASVAAALAVGAILMLLMEIRGEKRTPSCSSLDELTPRLALGIGLFQCLALWPGFSRSAATIMGGMLLGTRRTVAAEYSFIAAVPLMAAATAYDVLKTWWIFTLADLPLFAAGMVFSFLFAWLAVRTFIALVGHMTLRPFAWYRLALAPVVYFFLT